MGNELIKMVIKFFYWNLRGLGEPVRLMLEHLGVDYESKHPDGEEWKAQKYNLGMDYPNLPYLIDGDVKLSQSYAIMRHLSRKFKTLGGETEEEMRAVDVAEGFANDLRIPFLMLWFKPDYEAKREEYFKELPNKLKSLENKLSESKWSAGNKLTYPDFVICETLDHHEMNKPGCLQSNPNVKKYKEAFFALPKIDAYRKSGRFQAWPVSGGSARWGNDNNKK